MSDTLLVGNFTNYVIPTSHRFRNGQWVRFEMPDKPTLVIVESKKATVVNPDKLPQEEIDRIKSRTQASKCGRNVGIFLNASRTPLGVDGEDGNPAFAYLPATIVPQRAVLGLSGEQNVTFEFDGKLQTVHLLAESLQHVESLLIREDVPAHRDATCYADWNPRR